MTRYDDGSVAIGEIGMWVHRLTEHKPYFWEYAKVTVIAAKRGKRATWLVVRDEAGSEHRVLARRIYGEEAARRWHPNEARTIWGKEATNAQTH